MEEKKTNVNNVDTGKKKPKTGKKKKSPLKKIIIITVILIPLILGGFFARRSMNERNTAFAETSALKHGELTGSLNIKGKVESAGKKKVYSALGYPVKSIEAKPGDSVEKGDVLCRLDTADLEMNIKQLRSELSAAEQNSLNQLNSSEQAYNEAVKSLENGTNPQIVNAENALSTAKIALDAVKENSAGLPESELKKAQTAYDNAQKSLDAVRISVDQEISKLKNNVDAIKNSMSNDAKEISVKRLENQLAEAKVTAPISGTVTASYAAEGAPGSGLLFVVEDTENLIITGAVKEYDIGRIQTGMNVLIKSDSFEDKVYEGRLSYINPAARKGANGEIIPGADVEFDVEIELTSGQTELRIGMNARLEIILEKRENVYYASYDAVITDEDGKSNIFTAQKDGSGKYKAVSVPVVLGTGTDLYTEIKGAGLSEGMVIINDASAVTDGQQINMRD
ncbi:MAG: efflux RND transporter periplasmic adaptor subunit [Oscillospiraceae bacterium]|nr:efflux RND transporter periplasmic adaptor subunit [Oscillospiraceae bacterium]